MADAVAQAHRLAQPGDAVLLSPAGASFDMFRNYAHRAEVFIDAVKKLRQKGRRLMLYAARAPKPSAELDFSLLWLALGLLAIGLVMVYSASIAIAEAARYTGHNGEFYLLRQGLFIALGVGVGMAAFQVPMRVWQQAAPYLFLAGLLLLAVVLIPGIGREVNGSRRWIPLGFANLQPSELMKFLAVLYAADYTRASRLHANFKKAFCRWRGDDAGRARGCANRISGFVSSSPSPWASVPGGLNGKFSPGWWRWAVGFVFCLTSPYRLQRVLGFMDPCRPVRKRLPAVARADRLRPRRMLGMGLGGSVEKCLPANDTISCSPSTPRSSVHRSRWIGRSPGSSSRPSDRHRAAQSKQLLRMVAQGTALARSAGAHQHGVNVGLCHQGADPAFPVVRRQRHRRQQPGDRRAAAHRLGAPPDDGGKTF